MLDDHRPDLPHLIRLGVPASRLNIEDLVHAIPGEDVMATSNALVEAEATQERPQLGERNRRIGSPAEYSCEESPSLGHASTLPEGTTARTAQQDLQCSV
jgi:hypothetical protein